MRLQHGCHVTAVKCSSPVPGPVPRSDSGCRSCSSSSCRSSSAASCVGCERLWVMVETRIPLPAADSAGSVASQLPSPPRKSALASGLDAVIAFAKDVNGRVVLRSKPEVAVRLRKRLSWLALEAYGGAEFLVMTQKPREREPWLPVWHFEVRETVLGGTLAVSQANEISYSKSVQLNEAVRLEMSALYSLQTSQPFIGFNVHSTPGVSSAAGSNAISVHRHFSRRWTGKAAADGARRMVLQTDVDVTGAVTLPGTRFNSLTGKVGLQGPLTVDVTSMTLTASV